MLLCCFNGEWLGLRCENVWFLPWFAALCVVLAMSMSQQSEFPACNGAIHHCGQFVSRALRLLLLGAGDMHNHCLLTAPRG